MMVADNGSSWFITGAPDPGWDDTDLDQLKQVPGSAFEVVVTGTIQTPIAITAAHPLPESGQP